jgi:alkylation response protein AidB-like acyl-CoA dehydrogenase
MNDAPSPPRQRAAWPATDEAWLARIQAIGPALAAAAPESERARRLTPALMATLHREGLFRLLLPRKYRGGEAALATFVRAIEALALYDGSTSWCVCQAGGCAMMASFLDEPVAEAIWSAPNAVLAWGVGPAEAKVVDGGYRVTARISFVSGGHHATWLGAHCKVIEKDGTERMAPDGRPERRTVLFPAGVAPLTDDWNAIGLKGTGSDSFAVEDLFVAEDHTLVRDELDTLRYRAPLYLFPAYAVYGGGFAGTALGIARAFMDEFRGLAPGKQPRSVSLTLANNPVVHDELARCEARLSAARAFLLGECERIWDEVVASDGLTVANRMRIRLAATHAIQESVAVVDALYNTAGTSAIFPSSPFERRFRDIHTVAQQIQGRKSHFAVVGAWMLGHPPDLNVI